MKKIKSLIRKNPIIFTVGFCLLFAYCYHKISTYIPCYYSSNEYKMSLVEKLKQEYDMAIKGKKTTIYRGDTITVDYKLGTVTTKPKIH